MNVEIINLSKSYNNIEASEKHVIKDLSLKVSDEIIVIFGPNGSGKSTLLKLISGQLKSDSGTISFLSNTTKVYNPKIGYVWQNYKDSLLPWYNILDNIAFPLSLKSKTSKKQARNTALEHFSRFDVDIQPDAKIQELSGGQQQLVAILRSLVIEPDILLMDEPLSSLDHFNRWNMILETRKICKKSGILTFYVTHDIDGAIMMADKIVMLSKKKHNIERVLENPNSVERTIHNVTSAEHVRLRNILTDFLITENRSNQ